MEPSAKFSPGEQKTEGKHIGNMLKLELLSDGKLLIIITKDGISVVRDKDPADVEIYDDLMGYQNRTHYTHFYNTYTVYNETYKNKLVTPLEGKLLRVGPDFYYVMDGKRRGFPDYSTFLALDFQECLVNDVTATEVIKAIPMGLQFSTNITESLSELDAHRYLPNYLSERTGQPPNNTNIQFMKRVNSVVHRHQGQYITYTQFESSMTGEQLWMLKNC